MRIGSHPRLLGNVFRLAVAAKDRTREPINTLVVSAHEDLEKVDLPCTYSPDDLLV
jgi:hypothetical protein